MRQLLWVGLGIYTLLMTSFPRENASEGLEDPFLNQLLRHGLNIYQVPAVCQTLCQAVNTYHCNRSPKMPLLTTANILIVINTYSTPVSRKDIFHYCSNNEYSMGHSYERLRM